tara:strand:+ start:723 stop:1721 length:999 start_codon:yes stop_codon:yes gene_type:complete
MKLLVTGGLGYIGSHTVLDLLEKGFEVIIFDNLSNSEASTKLSLQQLSKKQVTFVNGDLRDFSSLSSVFDSHKIGKVLHFGGLKSISESVLYPADYYYNNVVGTLNLLKAMRCAGVTEMVFSSSASVYGKPQKLPLIEESETGGLTNPYARTKLMIEHILRDYAKSESDWAFKVLRYFNPVGAHKSGFLGERPSGIPNNLMPFICQVAAGERSHLAVYGNDYNTRDGTGTRDYLHVIDLAEGHASALQYKSNGFNVWNLGTGKDYSVLEVIAAFERVNRLKVDYQIVARRDGDVASCFANADKAKAELNWSATRTLDEMVEDAWRFQYVSSN